MPPRPSTRARLPRPAVLAVVALLAASAARPAPLAAQGGVAGVVTDSVAGGAPLAGATVQLVRQDDPAQVRSVVTDSLGAFRVDDVPAGRYLLGFLHPRLDDLRLHPPSREVAVAADGVLRADLAIPSGRVIADAICGRAPSDSSALLLGRLQRADAEETPTTGEVTVEWLELVFSAGGVRQERRLVRAPADAEGRFALCGVPVDVAVLVQASAGDATSGQLELQGAPFGLLHRDILVAPSAIGTAAAAATRAVRDGGAAPLARGRARLSGRVLGAGGRPFARAQVLVHGTGRADTTGADGAYALDSLPAGTYTLEARAIGFTPRRLPVDLRADRPARAEVTLGDRVPTLDAVTVYGRPNRRRDLTGFMERANSGMGRFLTPAMIERRAAYSVPDLLRMVPGVRVNPTGGFGTVLTMRGQASFDTQCLPAVFLDGVFLFEGAVELERTVSPSEVMGIEVYAGPSTVPAEFQRGQCGSIVIWTKR